LFCSKGHFMLAIDQGAVGTWVCYRVGGQSIRHF